MIKILRDAIKVNTIYSNNVDLNTGNDEILELIKLKLFSVDKSNNIVMDMTETRALISFDNSIINSNKVINSKVIENVESLLDTMLIPTPVGTIDPLTINTLDKKINMQLLIFDNKYDVNNMTQDEKIIELSKFLFLPSIYDKMVIKLFKCNITSSSDEVIEFKVSDTFTNFTNGIGNFTGNTLNGHFVLSDNKFLTYYGPSWTNFDNYNVRIDSNNPIGVDDHYSIWSGGLINSPGTYTEKFTKNILYDNKDVYIDVSNYFKNIPIEKNRTGLLLKIHNDPVNEINVKFFNNRTNTIYKPIILSYTDDYVWNPPTTNVLDVTNKEYLTITIGNLKSQYSEEEIAFIRIFPREKYNTKNINNLKWTVPPTLIHSKVLYSVLDYHTNEVIIPFDEEFTRVSCDTSGNYFKFYMTGFSKNRFYKIILKTQDTPYDQIIDTKSIFKVF